MKKRAVVTVGVSESRGFKPYHERFRRSFEKYACADVLGWDTNWPPGSPSHHDVHYAFKVYAVKEALRRDYTSILYLDCCAYAVASLEPLWQYIEHEGHYLAAEPPNNPKTDCFDRLGTWSGDFSLAEFGISRDDAMCIPLLSGTCFGLDFTHEKSKHFFNTLLAYAVAEHFNGSYASKGSGANRLGLIINPGADTERKRVSNDPRVEGHRSDEVYMSALAHKRSMKTTGELFTGGMGPRISTVIRSGYSLGEELNPHYKTPDPTLELIGEHTINTALLRPGGPTIDAGCRDFIFAREIAKRGCAVIALDADPNVEDANIKNVDFKNSALVAPGRPHTLEFVLSGDPQARHLAITEAAFGNQSAAEDLQFKHVSVQTTTLVDLLGERKKIGHFDLIKLDIEGAEYDILANWPGPISKQISVEFHEHVKPRSPETYERIFTHLAQWYDVVQHHKEARHGCGPNYWDTLLQLKDAWLGWGAQ